ncbi:tripartite tricarboxylate transporter substrate binding protein [Variovorax sp. efr-133-TYG-130]|uniref:Bug family tripartite tricarboxylate transporter substrate binding protein n=1 Tax=Variovorax sp. efr-133-TYG-130 TaxID=3040327 RepID=UPI0025527B9F|nr:tripartite tricarboxylate transporter substrate binding protein [Variovorax sp. efr-133-TYG-130]
MKISLPSRVKKTLAVCLVAASAAAHAAWPERPITLIVPYAPGGAADSLARVLGTHMSTKLGTSVLVDNRPGASGTIGAAAVAKAKPDGYTVLYDATPNSINPHLVASMPYAPGALQPVSLVSLAPNILIVSANSPLKDVNALIAKAKAQPGTVNFASGGSGTVQRLAGELFRQQLNLDMVHVPYKSGSPAITDVMAGQVDFSFSTVIASQPLVASGKLRALAISSPQRSARLPDVPTVAETVIPGFEVYEWNGLFVPKGTPQAVVNKIHQALVESLKEDEVKRRFSDAGAQAVGSTPGEFAEYLKKEDAKWSAVVRKGDIKAD